jgi:hypothetical protein
MLDCEPGDDYISEFQIFSFIVLLQRLNHGYLVNDLLWLLLIFLRLVGLLVIIYICLEQADGLFAPNFNLSEEERQHLDLVSLKLQFSNQLLNRT